MRSVRNDYGLVLSRSSHNKLISNAADSNTNYGYHDNSMGSGTAGTGNAYSLDERSGNGLGGSIPSRLCTPQI